MFRELRRKKQKLSKKECIRILEENKSGVLAVIGDHGYPYTIPLSYVYLNNSIYFHAAKEGHKIDAIKKDNKVSFCVIDQDQIIPEEYTTYFRSVVVFGKAYILEETREFDQAIEQLAIKYNPDDQDENRSNVINQSKDRMNIIRISIEHLSGKEAIELVRKK